MFICSLLFFDGGEGQTRIIGIFDGEEVRFARVEPIVGLFGEVGAAVAEGDAGELVVEVEAVELEEAEEEGAEGEGGVGALLHLDEGDDHEGEAVGADAAVVDLAEPVAVEDVLEGEDEGARLGVRGEEAADDGAVARPVVGVEADVDRDAGLGVAELDERHARLGDGLEPGAAEAPLKHVLQHGQRLVRRVHVHHQVQVAHRQAQPRRKAPKHVHARARPQLVHQRTQSSHHVVPHPHFLGTRCNVFRKQSQIFIQSVRPFGKRTVL